MHWLVTALFVQILVVEYLIKSRGFLHPYAILLPEVLSGVAMLVVLIRIMGGARVAFDWRYGLFLAALLFTVTVGFLVQDVPDGAMLAGARSYIKFLPFFLLPAVHRFTPKQLHAQLVLLLVLAMLQTPLAVYQRFVEFASSMHSGDPVKGTLTTSSAMSLFMLAAIAGAVSFYLRGHLRLRALLVLCAWLFLPTTINETKATLLLLPFALLVPAMLMPGKGRHLRQLAPIVAVGFVAVTAFVLVYNYLIQFREHAGPISEYFTGGALHYLYTGAANTDEINIGRFDSIEFALDYTSRDPLTLARSSNAEALLGQIWAVAVVIMTFGLVYKAVFAMNDLGYPFWYFSGVVASRAVLVRQAARRRVRQAPESWHLAAGEPRGALKGCRRAIASMQHPPPP